MRLSTGSVGIQHVHRDPHGHPDGDLMTSIVAYEWYLECIKNYSSSYSDWRVNSTQEWKACTKVGLIHHVLVAIHESVLVLKHT